MVDIDRGHDLILFSQQVFIPATESRRPNVSPHASLPA